jgi:hypothetical protein
MLAVSFKSNLKIVPVAILGHREWRPPVQAGLVNRAGEIVAILGHRKRQPLRSASGIKRCLPKMVAILARREWRALVAGGLASVDIIDGVAILGRRGRWPPLVSYQYVDTS